MRQETIDKLRAIQHMLRTDEHTRKHWVFWTVYTEVSPYIAFFFEEQDLPVPCGSVGCAIGHAHRMGLIKSESFTDAREEIGMDKYAFDDVFENIGTGRDHDSPDDVADRIDKVIIAAQEEALAQAAHEAFLAEGVNEHAD